MKINFPPPIENYPLSQLLKISDRRMLSVAGQKIYDPFRIYLGTGHMVKEEMSRLLITTQLLFYFEDDEIRKMTLNDVVVPTKIDFKYLNSKQIALIQNSIDVHHDRKYDVENPFNFNYEIFGYYLESSKEFNKILSTWADIMVNEWRVLHGLRLFIGFGYDEFSEKLHNGELPLELSGLPDKDMVKKTGVNLVLLRGLWFANNIIIRLQALWDKMISEFLLKSYFSCNSGKTLSSRLRKLEQLSINEDLSTSQKEFLIQFLKMSDSITELRQWRDHDVHMVSEVIQEVYSKNPSDKDLFELWNRINELHNTTKEALYSLIGFIVSGNNYPPEYILRILGEGKQLKSKFYNPAIIDEQNKLIELQRYAATGHIGDNIQRVMDILMDIWGIKITSDICRFNVFSKFSFPAIKE